jgi:hypothetical protein
MTYFTWRDFLNDLMPEDIVVGLLLGITLICIGLLMVGLK